MTSEQTKAAVYDTIFRRRAVRSYSPHEVPESLLLELLALANRAPSSFNIQPWHFIVVRDQSLKILLRRVAMNQRQITEAPYTVVFAADPEFWRRGYEEVLAESERQDTLAPKQISSYRRSVELFWTGPLGFYGLAKRIAVPLRRLFAPTPGLVTSKAEAAHYVRSQTMLAAANFMIAATAAGLATSPMEGFDEYRLKRLLAIPLSFTVPIIIAVGYPAETGEVKQSVRLPLKERVSWDLFGEKRMSCDVMVFSAHPDDAEFIMGGTMIRFARAGKKLVHVALTPSQMSTHGDMELRRKEFEEAAGVIGCTPLMLDFMDTQIENDGPSRIRIARLIREHRPTIVFAPYHTNPLAENGGSAHRDHYTSGALVRDAVKLARLEKTVPDVPKHTVQRSFFYMLPRNVLPNVIVDVTPFLDDVEKLIRCYTSQMAINVRGIEVFDSLMTQKRAAGLIIGARYAEHFVTDTPVRFEAEHFLTL